MRENEGQPPVGPDQFAKKLRKGVERISQRLASQWRPGETVHLPKHSTSREWREDWLPMVIGLPVFAALLWFVFLSGSLRPGEGMPWPRDSAGREVYERNGDFKARWKSIYDAPPEWLASAGFLVFVRFEVLKVEQKSSPLKGLRECTITGKTEAMKLELECCALELGDVHLRCDKLSVGTTYPAALSMPLATDPITELWIGEPATGKVIDHYMLLTDLGPRPTPSLWQRLRDGWHRIWNKH